MPYILISTQIRLVRILATFLRARWVRDLHIPPRDLETGPTIVGDEYSDPDVMNYLGARKTTMLGNNFSEYHVDDPPRVILNKLELIGYRVVGMTGMGQTLAWCLHKETM